MKQRPWRSSENAGAKPSKDRRTYVSASQEETLKASMRLGLLGLFAVLAAAFGVSQIGTVSAQPPGVTKNCALTGGGAITGPVPTTSTVTCTIILDATVVAVAEPVVLCGAGLFCVDPTTGLPIFANAGSVLNGSTIFTIDNSLVASWTGAAGTNPGSLPSTAGFTVTANQVVARCGFFPTTGLPAAGFPGTGPNLGSFFGGCESNSATYRGNNPGVTNISATFVPDLPGAYGVAGVLGTTIAPSPVLPQNFTALLGGLGLAQNPTAVRALEVTGAVPSGAVALARGCNNVSPTVTEAAAAYAARVTPQSALVAIWEHQAATNTFRGFSPQPGAPNDLAGVTRLRPVFVCVNAAANLDQPAA